MTTLEEAAREELRREYYELRKAKVELWRKGKTKEQIEDERKRQGLSGQTE